MRVLVTGGAGFIGSNLVRSYLGEGHEVRILDDLSTGFAANIPEGVELVQGDVADPAAVAQAVVGTELVFHEAASRAVLRSVEDPVTTDRANTLGTLQLLLGARDAGVRRVVIASSSSVYGGVAPLPTGEDVPLTPKSPYAVSKMAGEQYARVFFELYGLETVALRYFNVFGPRQRPDSAYAAVIPLFCASIATGVEVEVHGDGLQSRDFTYVDDVVAANRLAAAADAGACAGRAFNIARGDETTLLDLLASLGRIYGRQPTVRHTPSRAGDVRRSRADIAAARRDLGFEPAVTLDEGLQRTVSWLSTRG